MDPITSKEMKKETIDVYEFLREIIPIMSEDCDSEFWPPNEIDENMILDFFDSHGNFNYKGLTKDNKYPFRFIDDFEQRGDGSGYETFYIWKRKSDGKYFYYYCYDGRLEVFELTETQQQKVVKWDFECSY